MGFTQNSEVTLAKAADSSSGLGKIGTVPAAGVLYVRLNCDKNVEKVDWQVSADGAHTVQLYRARTIVQSVTLTLASLADNATLIINGLTYAAKDSGMNAALRYFNAGGTGTAAAGYLTTVINNPASGTLGLTATSAAAVVTVVPSSVAGASIIQAVTGTAAGNCAVASTTLVGLVKQGLAFTGKTTTAAYAGDTYEQWCDGWPYCYLSITSTEASAAITPVVKATRYWS